MSRIFAAPRWCLHPLLLTGLLTFGLVSECTASLSERMLSEDGSKRSAAWKKFQQAKSDTQADTVAEVRGYLLDYTVPIEDALSAVKVLGDMGGEAKLFAPALVEAIAFESIRWSDEANKSHRETVLGALLKIDPYSALAALGRLLRGTDLERQVHAVDSRKQAWAFKAIPHLGPISTRAVPILVEVIKTARYQDERDSAAKALIAIGSPGVEGLVAALEETVPYGGIGAIVRTEDGFTKIVSLVPDGPAAVDGRLKPNDQIEAIAQGDGPFLSVGGFEFDRLKSLLRGKRGTKVRLKIIPSEAVGSSKRVEISLVRSDLSKQVDTEGSNGALRSVIIQVLEKIGNPEAIAAVQHYKSLETQTLKADALAARKEAKAQAASEGPCGWYQAYPENRGCLRPNSQTGACTCPRGCHASGWVDQTMTNGAVAVTCSQ